MKAKNNGLRYLNLGCGKRYLTYWTNIDFVSCSNEVIAYNLRKGIPYPDNTFDVVYHSHLLEHFTKEDAFVFLKECYRVLKKSGIIRVVVPDLEQIVIMYLQSLEQALAHNSSLNDANYDWAILELYDQIVRNVSGGEMLKYWKKDYIENEERIIDRTGSEFLDFRAKYMHPRSGYKIEKSSNYKNKLIRFKLWIKEKLIKSLLQEDYFALQTGKFRLSGEIHQWMYDQYSLNKILTLAGFKDFQIKNAFESNIPDWEINAYLDVEAGIVRKPDSIFVEAFK